MLEGPGRRRGAPGCLRLALPPAKETRSSGAPPHPTAHESPLPPLLQCDCQADGECDQWGPKKAGEGWKAGQGQGNGVRQQVHRTLKGVHTPAQDGTGPKRVGPQPKLDGTGRPANATRPQGAGVRQQIHRTLKGVHTPTQDGTGPQRVAPQPKLDGTGSSPGPKPLGRKAGASKP